MRASLTPWALVCTAPFGYTGREIFFLSVVGLRGAVPIVLATIPVLAGVRGAACDGGRLGVVRATKVRALTQSTNRAALPDSLPR